MAFGVTGGKNVKLVARFFTHKGNEIGGVAKIFLRRHAFRAVAAQCQNFFDAVSGKFVQHIFGIGTGKIYAGHMSYTVAMIFFLYVPRKLHRARTAAGR